MIYLQFIPDRIGIFFKSFLAFRLTYHGSHRVEQLQKGCRILLIGRGLGQTGAAGEHEQTQKQDRKPFHLAKALATSVWKSPIAMVTVAARSASVGLPSVTAISATC